MINVTAALAACAAGGLSAQSVYLLRRGTDTVAIERVTRTGSLLRGQIKDGNGAQVDYQAELAAQGGFTRIDYSATSGEGDKWSTKVFLADKDVRGSVTREGKSEDFKLKTGLTPMPGFTTSYAFYEEFARRTRKSGGSARFTLLRMRQMDTASVNVVTKGDSVIITLPQTEIRFRTDAAGNLISGRTYPQGLVVERQRVAK
jgi:hypothetical protein